MKTRIVILFLSLLMPMSSVVSQVSDLGAFEGLVDGLADKAAEEPLMPEDEIQDNQKDLMQPKIIRDFRDKNYSFTGGTSFLNPPQSKFFDEPLGYFGYDFFVNAPTTFAPVKNIPIPPDYILGPGDNIKILLYGTQNKQFTLQVTREGEIFIPEVGSISVAGLTFVDMKKAIEETVSNKIIGTDINITLGSLRSINIFVLGDAYQPGVYTVSALSTLTNAVFASGGINPTGSLRHIQLKRNGKVISSFDFYQLLLKGDTSDDVRLMAGDVVFIPPITKTVGIAGEVGRPAIYELKENETLQDLIEFSGNLKPKANIHSSEIQRIDIGVNGFKLMSSDLYASSLDSFDLHYGDLFKVYPVVDNLNNAILLTGHAQRPGFFSWKEGMKIGDLITSSDDVLSMTDLRYVLIKREDKSSQDYQFFQADLEEIFSDSTSNSNLVLFEKDEIIFFPTMLSPGQITTKLIQDKYIFDNNQMLLEDEWTSMTYLRKSLMEENVTVEKDPLGGTSEGAILDKEDVSGRYYEYSIYDYCTIPEDLASKVVESSGFRTKKVIPLEELEKITTPQDILNLQSEIEDERIKTLSFQEDEKIVTTITKVCRQQLIEPVMDLIARQVVPNQQKKVISVYGNVHFPGSYPLSEGMTLEDAIKASGGLKEATYNAEIELSRSNLQDKKFSVSNSFGSISDPAIINQELKALDIINVKRISGDVRTVELTGEVFFAGVYPISENETLGDLIRRAGGITELGDIKATVFLRKSLKEAELKRLQEAKEELSRSMLVANQSGRLGETGMSADIMSQLTSLLGGINEEDAKGRLVINLESILDGSIDDVILEASDIIHVPKLQQSVSVIGEVYVPNSHIYKTGFSIQDYINFSGGVTDFADENSIYLIKSDGSIISPSQVQGGGFFRGKSQSTEAGLGSGDTIVVPLEVQPFSAITATTEITQIIYQMALAAAAVNSF